MPKSIEEIERELDEQERKQEGASSLWGRFKNRITGGPVSGPVTLSEEGDPPKSFGEKYGRVMRGALPGVIGGPGVQYLSEYLPRAGEALGTLAGEYSTQVGRGMRSLGAPIPPTPQEGDPWQRRAARTIRAVGALGEPLAATALAAKPLATLGTIGASMLAGPAAEKGAEALGAEAPTQELSGALAEAAPWAVLGSRFGRRKPPAPIEASLLERRKPPTPLEASPLELKQVARDQAAGPPEPPRATFYDIQRSGGRLSPERPIPAERIVEATEAAVPLRGEPGPPIGVAGAPLPAVSTRRPYLALSEAEAIPKKVGKGGKGKGKAPPRPKLPAAEGEQAGEVGEAPSIQETYFRRLREDPRTKDPVAEESAIALSERMSQEKDLARGVAEDVHIKDEGGKLRRAWDNFAQGIINPTHKIGQGQRQFFRRTLGVYPEKIQTLTPKQLMERGKGDPRLLPQNDMEVAFGDYQRSHNIARNVTHDLEMKAHEITQRVRVLKDPNSRKAVNPVDALSNWLEAGRALELHQMFQRWRDTGGVEGMKPVVTGHEKRLPALESLYRAWEPLFKDILPEVRKVERKVLEVLGGKDPDFTEGISMLRPGWEKMMEDQPNHVPFWDILMMEGKEQLPFTQTGAKVTGPGAVGEQATVQPLEGSPSPKVEAFQALLDRPFRAYHEALANKVKAIVAMDAGYTMGVGGVKKPPQGGSKKQVLASRRKLAPIDELHGRVVEVTGTSEAGVISPQRHMVVMDQGERRVFRLPPKIANEVNGLTRIGLGDVGRTLGKAESLLRAGAVGFNIPYLVIKNVFRDIWSSGLASASGTKGFAGTSPLRYAKSILESVKEKVGADSPVADTYKRLGSLESIMTLITGSEGSARMADIRAGVDIPTQFKSQIANPKNLTTKTLPRWAKTIASVLGTTEQGNRIFQGEAVRKNALKHGWSERDAWIMARKAARWTSGDFYSQGLWGGAANIFKVFLTANVAITRTGGRALRERPGETISKLAVPVGLAAMVTNYWNNSRYPKVWNRIDENDKKDLLFITGDGFDQETGRYTDVYRIILPDQVYPLWRGINKSLDAVYKEDPQQATKEATGALLLGSAQLFSPIRLGSPGEMVRELSPTLGVAPIEVSSNARIGSGGRVYWPDKSDPNVMVNRTTSGTSYALGKGPLGPLINRNPAAAEHIAKGLVSSFPVDMVLGASDKMFKLKPPVGSRGPKGLGAHMGESLRGARRRLLTTPRRY